MISRRNMLKLLACSGVAACTPAFSSNNTANDKRFDISLSQWSFHREILGGSKKDYSQFIKTLHSTPDDVLQGTMDTTDIVIAARKLGVSHVDLVNVLFFGHAQDKKWLNAFKSKARNEGVGFNLLMCDETGKIGHETVLGRKQAIDNHLPWLECASELGCKQLRVNAYGDGNYLEQLQRCSESLNKLADISAQYNIELLVENHGNASNNGAWLAMLMQMTAHKNVGVFTDLDNFFMGGWNLSPKRLYDRTQGLIDLAPYTKGISAKTHNFTLDGEEVSINYQHCLNLLVDEGFNGFVSAEYEGDSKTEIEGSDLTVKLLKKYQYLSKYE
ncbi:Xylose isomerase-like TIM barrel [Pseudoalteromonas sp. P1-30]|uniref:sugar phosphate isomerase/epimerase family protein n=2 Tax=Pseudoalteromonas TaxID=53246 RepID=UPI0007077EF1|nr:sugar phosphate isomerase/epimerase family protein [Pseudoalteromonas sp. P1-30]KPV90094.1 Xylose isomerase-like TIM barrel [Pseudoalteromonas sp. P1-30]